jgi:hypothetical protein
VKLDVVQHFGHSHVGSDGGYLAILHREVQDLDLAPSFDGEPLRAVVAVLVQELAHAAQAVAGDLGDSAVRVVEEEGEVGHLGAADLDYPVAAHALVSMA